MKKIFAILSSALFLAAAGLFTACSTEDDLTAPTETWVEKTYTYTGNDGKTSQLTCYFMYTSTGYSNTNLLNVPTNSQNGSTTTIKPGLTIVAVPATSSELANTLKNAVTGSKTGFFCKTFGTGNQSETDDSDSSSFTFNMSETKWNLFYYANIASFLKNDQLKNPPTPLKSSGYAEYDLNTDDLKKAFSWKKLLANYLLGSL